MLQDRYCPNYDPRHINKDMFQANQEGRGAEYQGKNAWEIVPEYFNFE